VQTTEFFVVGGPIQSNRPCYIRRRADQDLIQAIVDQRFSYVLSARGTGKSSLMASAIRTLREESGLAAGVDLTQIGARGEGADSSRWFYSIAHRILRELRLKVDLQAWWQERTALSAEQIFADFFWEIVLSNTRRPVTIFLDEIERCRDLPFASELFSVIRECYALRVSEPDYARLNFVVLGVATPLALCPDVSVSPFPDGEAIPLEDFSLEECYRFTPGFDESRETARALIERIHGWTRGQPYLTQKLARAVNRKGGRLEHVERVAQELFLSPGLQLEEPLLNHTRRLLGASGPHRRQMFVLLSKVSRGMAVAVDSSSPAQEELRLAGLLANGPDGTLRYRNRIVAEVFDEKWAKSELPFNWRATAIAASAVIVLILVPFWYFNSLPEPFIEALTADGQDFEAAENAYRNLHRLPGFAGTAEELFARVLEERSRRATTLTELAASDTVLRTLDGGAALADRLVGEFWLRRAEEAVREEQRDAALLYSIEALVGTPDRAGVLAASLIGDDYGRLERSFRLSDSQLTWAVDWDRRELTVIDEAHRARAISLDATVAGQSTSEVVLGDTDRITALQHVPLNRELSVDDAGSAGVFELLVDVRHDRPVDVTLSLTAPSGVSGSLRLADADRLDGIYRIRARSGRPLGLLADEQRQGVWRLTLIDGQAGNSGTLRSWGLEFPNSDGVWRDEPEQGIEVPDPVRTEQVTVVVSGDGRFAAATPSRVGGVGALAVWDLRAAELLSDMQFDTNPENVVFSADGEHLLGIAGNVLTISNITSGEITARLETQTRFLLNPALSPEGRYVAIAEAVDGAEPLFSLVRLADGELVASVSGIDRVSAWALGPEARYLALLSGVRRIDIMDPRRGDIVAQLELERTPQRLIPIPGDDLLLTVDNAGSVRAWRFALTPEGLTPVDDWRLGSTRDADSISVAIDASTVAFATPSGHVVAHDLRRQLEPVTVRLDRSEGPITTRVSPDGQTLIAGNRELIRLFGLADREAAVIRDSELSALAIDAAGRLAALGFRDGRVRAERLSLLGSRGEDSPAVDYIGHRGPVSAIALNTARNLIATGGNDGVVRAWNLASVSPSEQLMRHPAGPVLDVEISGDGQWLASAAEYSARIWRVEDGASMGELAINGTATVLAFAHDSQTLAVGDSAGNVFITTVGAPESGRSLRAEAAIQALSFSHDSRLLVTGDARGVARVWNALDARPTGAELDFRHPVRWLGFDDSGSRLFVQTDQWFHIIRVTGSLLEIERSHLLPTDLAAGAAWLGETARFVGGLDTGSARFVDIAWTAEPAPGLARRDWQTILGMTMNTDGSASPVTY
jgi:WD40 repeat protein